MIRLGDVLTDSSVCGSLSAYISLDRKWKACVGDTISFMTSVNRLKDGVLHVAVHEHCWISELNFMKGEFLHRLRQSQPDIRSINFFYKSQYKYHEPPKDVHKRKMTDRERSYADRMADTIDDEALRESFRKAIYSYFSVYSLDDYLNY